MHRNNLQCFFIPLVLLGVFVCAPETRAQSGSELNNQYYHMLVTEDPEQKIKGAKGLAERGIKATQQAVPYLLPTLRDKNKQVRIAGVSALGSMKWEAQNATPYLIDLLSDADKDVREAAAAALANIGTQRGREAVDMYRKGKIATREIQKMPDADSQQKLKEQFEELEETRVRMGTERKRAYEEYLKKKQDPEVWNALMAQQEEARKKYNTEEQRREFQEYQRSRIKARQDYMRNPYIVSERPERDSFDIHEYMDEEEIKALKKKR